jgi:hypothetical protein
MQTNSEGKHRAWFGDFFGAAAMHCVRRRWIWLAGVLLVTVFFIMQMPKAAFDNSSDIWFVEGDPSLLAKDIFDAAFGNDDFVFLLFTEEDTAFTPENLRAMNVLADELEEKVPYARKTTWLGNVEDIRSVGGGQDVLIEGFLENLPSDQAGLDARLQDALSQPEYIDNLISRDGTVLTMFVEFDTFPEKEGDYNPNYDVAESVLAILAQEEFTSLKPYVAGGPVFNYEYDKLAQADTGKLFLMIIVVQAGLLFWLGRGLRGVAVPLTVTILAVLWTMGSIVLMGFTMNLLTIALPTMLICVGIGDSMHGIAAFHDKVDKGRTRLAALREAFSEVGGPIMLTSLTTAAGFLAYLTTHVKPYREMGVYIALGVIFAFVLSVILTPILYSFGKEYPKKSSKRHGSGVFGDVFDRFLDFTHRSVVAKKRTMVVVFSALMAVTFVGYFMMKVESNTSKLLFKDIPLRQTLDLIDERLGANLTLEFLLDTEKESGIKDPAFMQKLDDLMIYAEEHPLVTKAVSVTDVLKKMRRALHGNDPAYYSLPETKEAVAQYLFLYESSGGADLDRRVGFTYDTARLSLKTGSLDTGDARALEEDMKAKIDELFGKDEIKVVESGSMFRYIAMNDILFEGQSRSFFAALTVITIVMCLVLRSVKLGLISMVPNVFPVFLTMGFMGLMGLYMDVITVSFAAVIIGVAVDDTIHFFTRFRSEFHRLGKYEEALGATLRSVGRPLTFTTIILVVGNAVFMTSSMLGFFKLGLLFGVAFTWALLADFFFAQALILLTKPLGPEHAGHKA